MKNTKSINGTELREFRKNQGWSQKELGQMLNVSQGAISQYELGKSHTPRKFSVDELEELCRTIATELVRRKSRGSNKKLKVTKVEIVEDHKKSMDDVIELLTEKLYKSLSEGDYDNFYVLCDSYKCLMLK